jgi:hypothetical protein
MKDEGSTMIMIHWKSILKYLNCLKFTKDGKKILMTLWRKIPEFRPIFIKFETFSSKWILRLAVNGFKTFADFA